MFTAFIDPGDEVIMFEPWFYQYLPSITFNGGIPVFVPLHPPPRSNNKSSSDEWSIDFDELRRAFSPKTKIILVNTPHNPVGKVFRRDELEKIAALAKEFNALVMSDEVVRLSSFLSADLLGSKIDNDQYECLVFDQKEHVRICTLPGMWFSAL